jgi:hypothetical protein
MGEISDLISRKTVMFDKTYNFQRKSHYPNSTHSLISLSNYT